MTLSSQKFDLYFMIKYELDVEKECIKSEKLKQKERRAAHKLKKHHNHRVKPNNKSENDEIGEICEIGIDDEINERIDQAKSRLTDDLDLDLNKSSSRIRSRTVTSRSRQRQQNSRQNRPHRSASSHNLLPNESSLLIENDEDDQMLNPINDFSSSYTYPMETVFNTAVVGDLMANSKRNKWLNYYSSDTTTGPIMPSSTNFPTFFLHSPQHVNTTLPPPQPVHPPVISSSLPNAPVHPLTQPSTVIAKLSQSQPTNQNAVALTTTTTLAAPSSTSSNNFYYLNHHFNMSGN